MAPTVVASAHKQHCSPQLYQDLGFEVHPKFEDIRTDIIQSIVLKIKIDYWLFVKVFKKLLLSIAL